MLTSLTCILHVISSTTLAYKNESECRTDKKERKKAASLILSAGYSSFFYAGVTKWCKIVRVHTKGVSFILH